jgi:RHS repeat-associated protein
VDTFADWTVTQSGGSPTGQGGATLDGEDVLLREGDSFFVSMQHRVVIPGHPSTLEIIYSNLTFDTTDPGHIKDAFEASLVDAQGQPLVHSIATPRDAFFNVTDGQPAALGQEATQNGQTVTLDLSSVLPTTSATLVLRLVNNDGDVNTSVRIACVHLPDDPPAVTLGLADDTAPPGAGGLPYTTDLLTNDPRVRGTASDDVGIRRLEAQVDGSAWQDITTNLSAGQYQFDPGSLTPGPHQIAVRATDTTNHYTVRTLDFRVNQPPVANAGGNQSVDEGGTVSFDGSASSDAEGPLFAYDWTFDDGSTASGPTATHRYLQDGTYPVTLRVTDTAGSVASDQIQVSVRNLPPVLAALADQTVNAGAPVSFQAGFTDPGIQDTHTARVNWGDGPDQSATVQEQNGAGTASASHVYTAAGMYTVTVTITDDAGAATSTSFRVTVQVSGDLSPAATKDNFEWGYRERGLWQTVNDPRAWHGFYRQVTPGTGSRTATWTLALPASTYQLFASWVADGQNAADAPYRIFDGNIPRGNVTRNQQLAPNDGTFSGQTWKSLGVYAITTGVATVELNDHASGRVGADGIIAVAAPPQLLAGTPKVADATAHQVTPAELEAVGAAAIAHWESAQPSAGVRSALSAAQFQVGDLGGAYLGVTSANVITIDRDAAGYGWFVDPTPADEREFGALNAAGEFRAVMGGPAVGSVDLLTVVSHELGHVLGLPDVPGSDDGLMAEALAPGVRRVPSGETIPPLADASQPPATTSVPPTTATTRPGIDVAYAQLPLSFEANQGQTDAQVNFLSRGDGYSLFLTPGEAVLSLHRPANSATGNAEAGSTPAVVRMQLVGGNPSAQASGLDPLPGRSNYFVGNDPTQWHTDIPTYGRVRYQDVYPGVDLIYYGSQRQLEYDFVVAPHADPGQIRLQFAGVDSLAVDGQGNLVLRTAGGEVVEHAPIIYQEVAGARQRVASGYAISGDDEVGFRLSAYDPNRPLIIDPVLSYSTYLGGSSGDYGHGIAVDAAGNMYIAGFTRSMDFPTQNPFQNSNHGDADIFVAKLNSQGSALLYSSYIGGGGYDQAFDIAVDSSGNAYLIGNTNSRDLPTTPGSFQPSFGGGGSGFNAGDDGFVIKVSSTGSSLVYSSYLGGRGNDSPQAIALDSLGNAYVVGVAFSGFPTTPGAFQPSYGGGGDDAFVVKVNATGTALVYSTYLGGSGLDQGEQGIAVDALGNAYVVGSTDSQNFPTTPGAFQTTFAGGGFRYGDAFVTKLNPTGSALVYSTYLGGNSNDGAFGVAVDPAGSAYVAGFTLSRNFPTANAFQGSYGGGAGYPNGFGGGDSFVAKLNPAGSALVYSTYLGGSGDEEILGIAVDEFGSAYVTGTTASANYPTANPTQAGYAGGGGDAFLTKISAPGSGLVYSTYLGGAGGEDGVAIALDSHGGVYVTGDTGSSDFPTSNPLQANYRGGTDAFVTRYNLGPPTLDVKSPADGSSFSAGTTVLVTGFASAPVLVDGKPVEVFDPADNFFTRVVVAPGQNVYHFAATDSLGQTTTRTLTLQGVQNPPGAIDFSLFSDVTASFTGEYGRTSFNAAAKVLYADLDVRNTGRYLADAPLVVEVTHISDPSVRVRDADGLSPDGVPYYDFSNLVAGGTLLPGAVTGARSLAFYNPQGVRFSYDLVILAKPNRAPAITTVPDVEALAGRPYVYAAAATDPDGDPVTFSLTTTAVGMAVDAATGRITWTPTSADIGTRAVTLRVEDGRGGSTEQRYVLSVIPAPPNRPPVFTSVPVVSANVNTAYAYQATATDPDGDALTFSVVNGPQGLTVNATSGLVGWTPTAAQLGTFPVTLRVSDGQGGTATQAYSIRVEQEGGNHPPVIVSPPVTTAVAGQTYRYNVDAVDPDNDPLTYSLTAGPTGMTINPVTGLVSWSAGVGSITEFAIPTANSGPRDIVTGQDGNLWFTEHVGKRIGRITAQGVVTGEWSASVPNTSPPGIGGPQGITAGSDGNLWYTGWYSGVVGRITTAGGVTEFGTTLEPFFITSGPDGNLWFTQASGYFTVPGKIGRINPGNGIITEWSLPTGNRYPRGITTGPDGNIWFVDYAANKIGQVIATGPSTGTITQWSIPTPNSGVSFITTGSDGNLWFTEEVANKIGQFNIATHMFTELCVPTANSSPYGIAAGPDGNLWFAETVGNKITSLDPSTMAFTEFTIPTPNSQPYQVTTGPDGNIWFVEYAGNKIGRLVPSKAVVRVRVEDGRGGFDTQSYTIEVVADRPPAIITAPVTSALIGQPYRYDVDAVDPDGDPVTYALTNPPAGMSINAASGVITWTPNGLPDSTTFPFRLGSVGQDQGLSSATDGAGNLYVGGLFSGTADFDPGPGVYNLTSLGSLDGFVAKYDRAGGLLWARRVGGSGGDVVYDLALDSAGNVYVTGTFSGTVNFDPDCGTLELTSAGGSDVFIWKLDGDGHLVWARRVGGAGDDAPYGGLEIAPDGNIVVAGWFTGTADFDPGPGTYSLTSAGGLDGFVCTLNSAGDLVWARRLGNSSDDQINGLAVDRLGNIYTAGGYNQVANAGPVDFDPGPGTYSLGGYFQAFVWKLDGAGNFVWARSLGSGGIDSGIGIAVDGTQNVYVTGYFSDTVDFDPGPGVFSLTSAGARDGFLWKLNADASFAWARRLGGGGDVDGGIGLGCDGAGNVYAAFAFEGTATFGPGADSFSVSSQGSDDALLLKLDSSGKLLWAKQVGGPGFDQAYGLTLDQTGNVFSAGSFQNTVDFDPGAGAFNLSSAGGWDAFVIGLTPAGDLLRRSSVTVRVEDGRGGVATQSFGIDLLTGVPGQIRGTAFDDRNENGSLDAGESGLAGLVIFLDQNQNGLRDPGEPFTTTGADGSYAFTGLVPGSYRLKAERPPGWHVTSPAAGFQDVTVASGQVVSGIDFGNFYDPTRNDPPTFTSVPPTEATVGQQFYYDAAASDPDGDPLTFDLTVRPAGMAVDPATGIVLWTPDAGQVGSQDVILRVQDGRGGVALQAFVVTVHQANTAPVITSTPTGPAVVNLPYQYQVQAQDADGDPISFRLDAGPAGMAISAGTGLLSWTPTSGQVGMQHVAITASDGRGGATTQSFDLPVVATATNHPPAISSTPRGSVRLGDTYLYAVQASDADADPLTFSLPTAPAGMTIDTTGLVTWQPTAAQLGLNPVQVRVTDGRGGFATQTFQINVVNQSSNRPPSITSTPPQTATIGVPYAYNLVGSDPDGDPLVWSLDRAPAGMSIDPNRGTVRWTPTTDQLGDQAVAVRVLDGRGGFATQSFAITVRPVNVPPAITSMPPTAATVAVAYTYAVRATDPENDPLTFTLTAAPSGMTIGATTGLVQWTPAAGQLGSQTVAIRVDDGQGGFATQTYTVVVSATVPNQPPVITSTPPFTATVGQLYQYGITAVDPEGQALHFVLVTGPRGMTVDPVTGLVSWTPALNQQGPQPVTVAAIDSGGAGGTQTFTITVAVANNPPTITSTPPQVVTAGLPYRYDVRASDPDGDPLTYTLTTGPAGMTMDNLGRVTWAPAIADLHGQTSFVYTVALTVADNHGAALTQTYSLALLADQQTPRVSLFLSANPVALGSDLTFVVTATDNVGVQSLRLTVGGTAVALNGSGQATVHPAQAGSFAVVASASDAAGNTGLATTTLLVIDTSDTTAPDVDLTAPADGAVITAPVNVVGTATDTNLLYYTLEAAPITGGPFTELFRGTTPVSNGVLGKFDPSLLADDTYTLRLTAVDAGGNQSSIEQTVTVAGDLKVGNFTLSFTDLSVPVSGIPITVGRTYDTLNAGTNSTLGFGWRLEFRDTDLRVGLERTGEEEYGVFTPFREGTHVFLTVPGGHREGFTFHPQRQGGFGGLLFYTPAFTPDRGVTSRLSVPDNVSLIRVGNEYYALNELPYNPADDLNYAGRYTLTTKDGLAYTIDAPTGDLLSVLDANGNTLTFSDAAIASSAGPRVTFTRDPQGRITAVTDPLGYRVRYRYDARGDLVGVTDREDHDTQFVYAGPRPHYLTQVIDPLGRTGVRTDYDDTGRLQVLTDGAGNPVHLLHDLDHFTETVQDALGHPTTFVYDNFGNVVQQVDALNALTTRTYDGNNNLLTETDPLGKTRRYTYDADGNVLTETDPLGHTTYSTYVTFTPGLFASLQGARPESRLATTTDPLGDTTTNSYDGAGNLLRTRDAAGNVTRYTYDAHGNQETLTDARDGLTRFQYDARGFLLVQTDAKGNDTTYTYDADGNQRTQTSKLTTPAGVVNVVTTTDYDHNGRPTLVTDAEQHQTRTEYDALGRLHATVDARGNRTEYVYDERGLLKETDYADGTASFQTYDAAGRRDTATDRAGRVTHFVYDAVGRLTQTIFPDATPNDLTDNPRTRTEYDDAGRVKAQVDELNHRTEFDYDDAGRQTVVRDALSHETRTTYDAAGRTTATTDALGHTTQFVLDALGRVTQTNFADGTSTGTGYDELGRVMVETDQSDRPTHYEYDPLGRLTAVVDALNQRTEYGYDEAGNLVTQTDANRHVTHYEYDRLGHRTATVLPLGQRSTTTYDAVGNVGSVTDFNQATVSYDYDQNNRLKTRHFPDGTAVRFTYTPTGQRETETDARGTTFYAYDERDRLLSRTDPDGTQISYAYDAAGNRRSVTTPAGTTRYTFDVVNRLDTVTDPALGVTRYTYDAGNNLRRTDLPNGTWEVRTYDALNRLSYLENDGPGGVLSSYRYTLDANGNRRQVDENTGRQVIYTYDALYRLRGEQITDPANGNRTIGYTLDPVGNRLVRTDSVEGETDYTYDDNDRLLTETLAGALTRYLYDNNGNTLSRVKSAVDQAFYHWDFENRLIGADVTDAAGTRHLDYQYDADGIRVASAVNGDTTRFLIDANRPYAEVLVEYRPSGLITASYVYGNRLLEQDRGGVRSYYQVDGLGSTRALTNASGGVTDRYVYDAFGRTIGQVGSTPNVYLFAGEQRDASVGLDYLRARYLSAGAGRFYGMDSFEGSLRTPVTLHRFLYGAANPVQNVDPSGRVFLELAVAAIAFGIISLVPSTVQSGDLPLGSLQLDNEQSDAGLVERVILAEVEVAYSKTDPRYPSRPGHYRPIPELTHAADLVASVIVNRKHAPLSFFNQKTDDSVPGVVFPGPTASGKKRVAFEGFYYPQTISEKIQERILLRLLGANTSGHATEHAFVTHAVNVGRAVQGNSFSPKYNGLYFFTAGTNPSVEELKYTTPVERDQGGIDFYLY